MQTLLSYLYLLTVSIFNNSHILDGAYFICPRKRTGVNLKVCRYLIWTSVKKSEKELALSVELLALTLV